jgi:hypothetical protein
MRQLVNLDTGIRQLFTRDCALPSILLAPLELTKQYKWKSINFAMSFVMSSLVDDHTRVIYLKTWLTLCRYNQ